MKTILKKSRVDDIHQHDRRCPRGGKHCLFLDQFFYLKDKFWTVKFRILPVPIHSHSFHPWVLGVALSASLSPIPKAPISLIQPSRVSGIQARALPTDGIQCDDLTLHRLRGRGPGTGQRRDTSYSLRLRLSDCELVVDCSKVSIVADCLPILLTWCLTTEIRPPGPLSLLQLAWGPTR